LSPPDDISAGAAHEEAVKELRAMGPWTSRQLALGALLAAMIVGWATESLHGVHSTGVALVGVTAILVMGIDKWHDYVGDRAAWDALIWLGGLVAMAEQLKSQGVVDWFRDHMADWVGGYSGVGAAVALALIYFFSMYGFSMLTGHVVALAAGFFVVGKAANCPPLLLVALISYFSNLCGCLTNYSTGPVVIYFQLGFVTPRRWLATGLAVAGFHLAVWLGVGLPYWKLLGWW
jgi:DASS family divalent anion:Na+ symporter